MTSLTINSHIQKSAFQKTQETSQALCHAIQASGGYTARLTWSFSCCMEVWRVRIWLKSGLCSTDLRRFSLSSFAASPRYLSLACKRSAACRARFLSKPKSSISQQQDSNGRHQTMLIEILKLSLGRAENWLGKKKGLKQVIPNTFFKPWSLY